MSILLLQKSEAVKEDCGNGRVWVIPHRMASKNSTPSLYKTSFDCPHCGVYTSQSWYDLRASSAGMVQISRLPVTKPGPICLAERQASHDMPAYNVSHLHLSRCFDCKRMAVWVIDKLLFPETMQGPPPNPDMLESVRIDYEEASKILILSPRGAAALLRLAIQKLCKELGEKGDNINDDIASLVKKGLSPLIQKALDSVRVIGNEAVHPGTLDLKDDPDTSANLFRLVNIIVEQMISNPKHVKDLYDKLPPDSKRKIAKRDK